MWTSGVVEETGNLPEENLNLVSHSRVTSPDRSVAFHPVVVASPYVSLVPKHILYRSTASRAEAPLLCRSTSLTCRSTSRVTSRVPEHLSRVPEHLSRVPEHLSRAGAPLSRAGARLACRSTSCVPEHLACRSTSLTCRSTSRVPKHLLCAGAPRVPEHLSVAVRMWSSWSAAGRSVVMCVLVVGLRACLVLYAGAKVSKSRMQCALRRRRGGEDFEL